MKNILSCILLFLAFNVTSQIDGLWHASFSIMGTTNQIDMNVLDYPNNPSVTLSDGDEEKFRDVKMDKLVVSDSTLSFTWTNIALTFKGKYFPNGDSIVGVMSQMDIKWGVTFKREKQEKIIVRRYQEPKEPFAYPVEELLIKNGEITLGATLTLPKNAGANFPIVVLASGSGPQDRNCEIMGHKSFLVIADYLARNGIACLRFDDRGIGKSTGVFQMASLEDFASDVNACVLFLKNDKRFDSNLIGIAGHSEGGMHALIAAKKNKNVKFIIELASVGTSGREVLIEQQYLIPLKSGKSEAYAQWNKETYTGICDIISNYSIEKATEPLNLFLSEMYEKAPQEYKDQTSEMNFKLGTNMFINNVWGRQFVSFESKKYLKKLKIPVLAINGSQDIQVPPISNQAGFEANFSKRSRKNSKAMIINGLNHLFQKCKSCTVYEYGELEETFSEEVLIQMRDWLKELGK